MTPLAKADVPTPGGTNSAPPIPFQQLDGWLFPGGNWVSTYGYPAVAWTNTVNLDTWASTARSTNGLLLDTGDPSLSIPGFLRYNVFETDGTTNLSCSVGAVCLWFNPDWTSTAAGGTGPGSYGRLLEVGSPYTNVANGWWSLYLDPGGSNLLFSTRTGDLSATCLSAPICWTNGTWHQVVLSYSATNCLLILDAQILTNNSAGVGYYPGLDVLAGGFFVGSDASGFSQARGQFADLTTWAGGIDLSFLAGDYVSGTNAADTWDPATVHQLFLGPRTYVPVPVSYTGPLPQIASFTAVTAGTNGTSVHFDIGGGLAGTLFDVFMTTNLLSPWQWLTNSLSAQALWFTNLPCTNAFFALGTPNDASGDGLTDAYKMLVYQTNAPGKYLTPSSDGKNTPDAWYIAHSFNPKAAGVAAADPDGDGLLNYQEYRWGTDPWRNDGFSVWVGGVAGAVVIP